MHATQLESTAIDISWDNWLIAQFNEPFPRSPAVLMGVAVLAVLGTDVEEEEALLLLCGIAVTMVT